MKIVVIDGNIAQVPAAALITTVSSTGYWNSEVDCAIQGVAGTTFHDQLEAQGLLLEGGIVHTYALEMIDTVKFDSVLFIVDNLVRPLQDVLKAVFQVADLYSLSTLTVPALRTTGATRGAHERTVSEALEGIVAAIVEFRAWAKNVHKITVVVDNDPGSEQYLKQRLGLE